MTSTPTPVRVSLTAQQTRPTRDDVLDTAKRIITGDRHQSYGDAEDSFGLVGQYWSVYLASRPDPTAPLAPHDVGVLMTLLKIARIQHAPEHVDSYVDAAGYIALAAEMPHVEHVIC